MNHVTFPATGTSSMATSFGSDAVRPGRRTDLLEQRWTRPLSWAFIALMLVLIPVDAFCSDDHGHGAPVAVPIQLAPRGQARADGVEAVVVAAPGRRLVVYLDRMGTSEPLEGASVEADADGVILALRDTGDGVYLGDDWFPTPGTNQVIVTWRLAGAEGKIEVAVDIPQTGIRPRTRAASTGSRLDQTTLGVAAALALVIYLLATALFVWRSRRQRALASG